MGRNNNPTRGSTIRHVARTIAAGVAAAATLAAGMLVAGTADAATIKAAKFTMSSMVPVVGGILSDAAETVLAAFRGDPLRVHPVAESSEGQGAASPVRDRTRRTPKTPTAGKKERLTDWVGRIAAEFEEPRARSRRKSRP